MRDILLKWTPLVALSKESIFTKIHDYIHNTRHELSDLEICKNHGFYNTFSSGREVTESCEAERPMRVPRYGGFRQDTEILE